MNIKPILTGKLNKVDNRFYTLMGHTGDIENLSFAEYSVLKKMDGFRTMQDISDETNIPIDNVDKIYRSFNGNKKVSNLHKWNKIKWCKRCQVHFAGERCELCNEKGKKIMFSPPCDPFIAFSKERKFILNVLQDKFNVLLPENTLFLVNNGVYNNIFFWEVEYCGEIVLKMEFIGAKQDTWKYTLMVKKEMIRNEDYLFNQETKALLCRASRNHMEKITKKSVAIIAETSTFFVDKPLLYFSAGKESMVIYNLLKKANISANIITVITGVEFPEDIYFMKEMKQIIDKDEMFKYYFYEENGNKIIEALNTKKKLSAKEPWCRVDFKRKLKNRGTEEIYCGKDFVAYEGSRWYENDFRRRHPIVNFISDYNHQVWVHPLAEWTSYELWIYTFQQNLMVNPLYYKGFQRTTCWLCPVVNPFHLYCSQEQYQDLWKMLKGCELDAFGDDKTKDLPF